MIYFEHDVYVTKTTASRKRKSEPETGNVSLNSSPRSKVKPLSQRMVSLIEVALAMLRNGTGLRKDIDGFNAEVSFTKCVSRINAINCSSSNYP